MRAATYVRLSASGLGEDAPGLGSQRQDAARLVRERGWELAHEFQDADISAFSGAPRPGMDELIAMVETGDIGAVVVWKIDRAFRNVQDAAKMLQLCRDRGAVFISQQEGIDTSTPMGEVIFILFAALAELESRTRSQRIVAFHERRANEGKPVGGGTRSFGFQTDSMTHEPSETRLIRAAVKKVLAGTSIRAVQTDWNTRAIVTPTGKPWSKTSLRRMLLSPRIAGLREHRGTTVPAAWKPIVTVEQHVQLRELYSDTRVATGRRYLLTGMATCTECGSKLIARPRSDRRRSYVCATDVGGCGKIRVLAAPFEEFVAGEVNRMTEQRQPEPVTRPPEVDGLRAQLVADENALDELSRARFVDRTLNEREYRAARDPLLARIEETQARVSDLEARGTTRYGYLANLDDLPPAPWEAEPGTDPDAQEMLAWRAWMAEYLEDVKVGPAIRGQNFFNPDRVEITWM